MAERHGADSIEVLQDMEVVRKRPGMYVGDVHDGSGLHHLIWEVVGNVIDLHLAGKATQLDVTVRDGWVEVLDDGPGFPVTQHGDRSAVERIFTTLHAGATYDGHFPHVHITSSMRGVGLGPVCALSAELEVETRTRGQVYRQRYQQGRPVTALERGGPSATSGARVRFRPDPDIFTDLWFDEAQIRARLHELAYLNPLMTVGFQGERFREREGIRSLVWATAAKRGASPEMPILRGTGRAKEVLVDAAFGWLDEGSPSLVGFVNQLRHRTGTQLEGLWDGLRAGLGVPPEASAVRERLGRGLIGVVHVGLYAPSWGAPTRDHLASPEAREATAEVVERILAAALRRDLKLRRQHLSRLR